MAKKLTDDFLKWTLDIDGKPAMKALGDWEQRTKKLTKENDALNKEMAKLRAHGKEQSDEYKKLDAQYKKNNSTIRESKKRMEELRKEVGLNGLNATQLRKKMRDLKRQMDATTPDTKEWKNLNQQLIATQKRAAQVSGGMKKTNAVFGNLKQLLPAIGIGTLVAGFKSLVSNVMRVRQEFEKYEAILTNSLGSQEAARSAMSMLQDLASQTPFQLSELTGAYVKLTNYGLKPTREQMIQYGDVAASVGKSMDQYVEAVADASQFEFERLKEFGIRASKQGDQIRFTFKGVTTEVAATSDSVQQYLASIGDAEGVSGSMAAISDTLGGKISNLGDAWDNLMNSMGESSGGIMKTVLDWMISFVNNINFATKSLSDLKQMALDDTVRASLENAMQEIKTMEDSLVRNGMEQAKAQKRAVELYTESIQNSIIKSKEELQNLTDEEAEQMQQRIVLMEKELIAVNDHYVELDKLEQNKQLSTFKKMFGDKKELDKAEQDIEKYMLTIRKKINDFSKSFSSKDITDKNTFFSDFFIPEEEEVIDEETEKLLKKIKQGIEKAIRKSEIDQGLVDPIGLFNYGDEEDFAELDYKFRQMLINEEEYLQEKRKLQMKYLDLKIEDEQDAANTINNIGKVGAVLFESFKQAELASIERRITEGLYSEEQGEEEKKKIMKKYADKEFIATAAQIIGSTAASIMKGYEQLGPIAGTVSAVIMAAIGATQLSVAQQQRQQVKQLRSGKYDVIGAEDGRTYNAPLVDRFGTGIVTRPTLVAEEPEIVVDPYRTNQIMTLNPAIMNAIMNPDRYAVVPQRASGKYPDTARGESNVATGQSDPELKAILSLLAAKLDQPIKASVDYYGTGGIKEANNKDAEMDYRMKNG